MKSAYSAESKTWPQSQNDKDNHEKPGQKIGSKGITSPNAVPDSQVEVAADRCPDWGAKLGASFGIESKLSKKFPNLSRSWLLNINIANYRYPGCPKGVVASDAECPSEG